MHQGCRYLGPTATLPRGRVWGDQNFVGGQTAPGDSSGGGLLYYHCKRKGNSATWTRPSYVREPSCEIICCPTKAPQRRRISLLHGPPNNVHAGRGLKCLFLHRSYPAPTCTNEKGQTEAWLQPHPNHVRDPPMRQDEGEGRAD